MRNTGRLLAFTIIISLALTTSPAQAVEPQSGGGCRTSTSSSGWQIAVCSSDDGVYMYPDYWIDIRPPYTGTCEVRSYTYLATSPPTAVAGPVTHACTADYGAAYPYPIWNLPGYLGVYHRVIVKVNGSTAFDAKSWNTYCC